MYHHIRTRYVQLTFELPSPSSTFHCPLKRDTSQQPASSYPETSPNRAVSAAKGRGPGVAFSAVELLDHFTTTGVTDVDSLRTVGAVLKLGRCNMGQNSGKKGIARAGKCAMADDVTRCSEENMSCWWWIAMGICVTVIVNAETIAMGEVMSEVLYE